MTADHPEAFAERRISAGDGLSLYVRDYGDGGSAKTPVLCLGGLTRNSKDYHQLARRLAPTRRVIAPDYRGRGRSDYDTDWRNYQPATYLDDIRHILIALGVHRVVVVGTSMGGLLAAGMTAAMPTVLEGVVLNDVGPVVERTGLEPIIDYMRGPATFPDWAAATERLRRTFPDFPAETDDQWRAIAGATYRQEADGRVRFDWDPALVKPLERDTAARYDFWPLFRGLVRLPALVLRGETSTILGAELMAEMAAALPRLETVTVPGVGHGPSLNEDEAREALDGFFRRV